MLPRRPAEPTIYGLAAAVVAANPPSDDAIRKKLTEILSRPEFGGTTRWWLLRWVDEFFHWLGGLYVASPVLYWVLLVGCVLALVLLVGHIIYTVWSTVAFNFRRAGQADGDARERRRRSAEYLEESAALAARGEYTGAVRCLFLSLIFQLDESGRVLYHPTFTNREYLSLFAGPDLRADLGVFVDTLDEHWYGERPMGPAEYERCRSLYDQFKRRAAAGKPSGRREAVA